METLTPDQSTGADHEELENGAEEYKAGLEARELMNPELEETYKQLSEHALAVRESINENSSWFMEHQGVENLDVKSALSEVIKKSDALQVALSHLNRLASNSKAITQAEAQDTKEELKHSEFQDDPNAAPDASELPHMK